MRTPQCLARIAGLCYLLVAVFAIYAHATGTAVHVPDDAATTARNVVAHAGQFRAGALANLVQAMFMLATGLALYRLLRHVSRSVAGSMLVFVVIMNAIVLPTTVYRFAAHTVATDGSFATALGTDGSDALVLLLLDMNDTGILVAEIFFGLWLLPLGYLVHRSGMFPRLLGILLMTVGCGGYLVNLTLSFLAPDLAETVGPYVTTPAGLVEFAMVLWLLIRGVKVPRSDGPVPVPA